MGTTPSYADVAIASAVLWLRVCGLPEDVERINKLHGGRWAALVRALERWGVEEATSSSDGSGSSGDEMRESD